MRITIKESVSLFERQVRTSLRANIHNYLGSPQVIGKSSGDCLELAVQGLRIPKFQHALEDQFLISDNETIGDQKKQKHLISIDDLLDIAAQELSLKEIIPAKVIITASSDKNYGAISHQGPEARKSFKRTFKKALLRQIAAGGYNPGEEVYPRRSDRRYHAPEIKETISQKALIINIKTPARTIGQESMERILTFNAWAELWLKRAYDEVVMEYIVHKNTARAVERQEYIAINGRGKMRISAAYLKCLELTFNKYSSRSWDIYVFHFSDGQIQKDNEGEALFLLQRWLVPRICLFGYGQVAKSDEEHHFYKQLLKKNLSNENKIRSFSLTNRTQIYSAMGICFGENGSAR